MNPLHHRRQIRLAREPQQQQQQQQRERERERGGEEMMRDLLETNGLQKAQTKQ